MTKNTKLLSSLVWIIVVLLLGGFIGNFVVTWSGLESSWIQGLMIAFVQALLLAVFGIVAGKFDIMTLIMATVAIFIGGILGGMLIQYLAFTGLMQTFVVLVIQAIVLMATGIVGKGKLKL